MVTPRGGAVRADPNDFSLINRSWVQLKSDGPSLGAWLMYVQ